MTIEVGWGIDGGPERYAAGAGDADDATSEAPGG